MSDFVRVLGCSYDQSSLSLDLIITWATELAKRGLLLPNQPYKRGTDMDIEEHAALIALIHDLGGLDGRILHRFRVTFAACFLPDLAITLHRTTTHTPELPNAMEAVIEVFEIALPHPNIPSVRMHLKDPYISANLAAIVSGKLLALIKLNEDIEDTRTGRKVFAVILEFYLVLGTPNPDGDGRSTVLPTSRKNLLNTVETFLERPNISDGEEQAFSNLRNVLLKIEAGKGKPRGLKDDLRREGIIGTCDLLGCTNPFVGACGKCMCTRYCSRECQRLDWTDPLGHRLCCVKVEKISPEEYYERWRFMGEYTNWHDIDH